MLAKTERMRGPGENTSPCSMLRAMLVLNFNDVMTTNQSGVFLKIAAHHDHGLNLDCKKIIIGRSPCMVNVFSPLFLSCVGIIKREVQIPKSSVSQFVKGGKPLPCAISRSERMK